MFKILTNAFSKCKLFLPVFSRKIYRFYGFLAYTYGDKAS